MVLKILEYSSHRLIQCFMLSNNKITFIKLIVRAVDDIIGLHIVGVI